MHASGLNAEEQARFCAVATAQIWVEEIHSECGKLRAQLLPESALGEAVNYTLNMWAKLAVAWITRSRAFQ